ncbi:hypothetical protein [Subtercola frigoramans]|uniref:Uncharacterized protein n=1 Tax=Subtercola frigoramans TaxID=120298 RepID=A0ABS2L7Q7_9MICO|nr:hypothetical protein [Subtercola frigoramans]MBM7473140.1 hypothetical protein [Subtercola frigoramans]
MEIGLNAFVKFTNASASARPRLARQIAEQASSEYDPATDFWRPMRQAISRDRKTSRDGSALREVAISAPALRRPSFEAISDHWGDVSNRWKEASFATLASKRVELDGLSIRVHPLFTERWADGHGEAVCVWLIRNNSVPRQYRWYVICFLETTPSQAFNRYS